MSTETNTEFAAKLAKDVADIKQLVRINEVTRASIECLKLANEFDDNGLNEAADAARRCAQKMDERLTIINLSGGE